MRLQNYNEEKTVKEIVKDIDKNIKDSKLFIN